MPYIGIEWLIGFGVVWLLLSLLPAAWVMADGVTRRIGVLGLIAWLIVVLVLPGIGPLAYFMASRMTSGTGTRVRGGAGE
jgi:hypothetical protein